MDRPALTVDVLVFTVLEKMLKVLLIRRRNPPFAGCWAIPGGFVEPGEKPCDAAMRELAEETGVRGVELREFGAFGDPGRDPRGWTVSIAYLALVSPEGLMVKGAGDAAEADWHPAERPPELAFDHALIVSSGVRALRGRIVLEPIAASLLPAGFTWTEFRGLYEILFGTRVDRQRLRGMVFSSGLLWRREGDLVFADRSFPDRFRRE